MCVRIQLVLGCGNRGVMGVRGACILDLLMFVSSRTSPLNLILSLSVLLALHSPTSVPLKHPHSLISLQH